MEPLNPELYRRLMRRLPGGVKSISRAGEAAIVDHVRDLATGRDQTRLRYGGENYNCACPYCGDVKAHLSVNHLYGVYDPHTGSDNTHLVHCFRCDCLKESDARQSFKLRILGEFSYDVSRTMSVRPGTRQLTAGRLTKCALPGDIMPITHLPVDSSARRYLEGRGYDLAELEAFYRVGYCTASSTAAIEGRIFIPIFMDGVRVGWQGRWPADLDWKCTPIKKYYNLPRFPKGLALYNFDLAKSHDLVVLVEGATDVWRVGPCAVALLGKTISVRQVELVAQNWSKVVVCLDADDPQAAQAAELVESKLRQTGVSQVVNYRLPAGLDPGSCPRTDFWEGLRRQADFEVSTS